MRRDLEIEEGRLSLIGIYGYGPDVLVDGDNVLGKILDWLGDEELMDVDGDLKAGVEVMSGLRISLTVSVTDGA